MAKEEAYKIFHSTKSVVEVISSLKKSIEAHGVTVFAVIDHAQAAKEVHLPLADEQLLIFGDPKVGTLLMQENPMIGIELPLKILAWSQGGKTHIALPNTVLWQKRFQIVKQAAILQKMLEQLEALAHQV